MGLFAASSAGLATMPSAGAAGYTCQGRAATIVGTAEGGPGSDVCRAEESEGC